MVVPAQKRAVPLKRGELAASPGSVGIERKKLRLQRRRDDETRVRQFKAMMEIMKKRGVVGLAPAGEAPTRRTAKEAGSVLPLQILAEGDSWFDYPPFLFKGGIIPRLEDRLGVPILNLAKAGDEVRYMLGVEERRVLIKQLSKGSPAGGAWDVLLFSGGGNDIVDNPMALWVRAFDASVPPQKLIHTARYDAALALVEAGYEDLITLRDALSPNTHLVFHGYDFAIPDGRGICHLGPWLKPTFDLRQFPAKSNARFEVVKEMLQQFAALLQTLEKNHRNVTFINGQGTLAPQPRSWHNELHPSRDGFDRFADLFHQKLKALFPGRVL
jgi:lysophospholipase L1-like esterase